MAQQLDLFAAKKAPVKAPPTSAAPYTDAGAELSACGRYRYALWRVWESGAGEACFIALNPSTADGTLDDPTIRKCVHFAKREGLARMLMLNLYALRTPSPVEMFALRAKGDDIVGPHNDVVLRKFLFSGMRRIIAAWGGDAHIDAARIAHIRAVCPHPILCLGTNKDGSPRHPLYLANTTPLVPWTGPRVG